MLASALRSYANRWAVTPAKKVAIFTNNDDGHRTAADLHAKGLGARRDRPTHGAETEDADGLPGELADLPVPPLSPDPNSLQGKILNLLDQGGDLGQFPTQAELAKRLEKSQQLISHHLRTLQKYGLVERRKMGVKNRYKLTREAVFLLETSDDFAHDDLL